MGYRGKLEERERARELRAQSWTLEAIADELGVSKSAVSLWVRDVDFVPRPRNRGHPAGPKHPMRLKKEAEIERCRVEADEWVGLMSERDLAMFCLGLYAGEGSKTPGTVSMPTPTLGCCARCCAGCGTSSTSTSSASGPASISTRGWTSTRRQGSGAGP